MQDAAPITVRIDRMADLVAVDPLSGDGYALEGPATNRIEPPPPTVRDTPAARAPTARPPSPQGDRPTLAAKLCALATTIWGSLPPPDSRRAPSSAPLPSTRR